MAISVVSTEGRRPERRVPVSTIGRLLWRQALSGPRFALRSRRRKSLYDEGEVFGYFGACASHESIMMDIRAGRPATLASNGMVTCPHALASQAGAEMLREGGSAIDAAIAASAALSVLYPHMTGIGGDAFWLIHDASTRTVRYIDGGRRATSRGTAEAFARRGLGEVPYPGLLPRTLTAPRAGARSAPP